MFNSVVQQLAHLLNIKIFLSMCITQTLVINLPLLPEQHTPHCSIRWLVPETAYFSGRAT